MQSLAPLQSVLFKDITPLAAVQREKARSGTFLDNMKLPVHRWFRYSAGFSAQWVAKEVHALPPDAHVFDPFAGSGTVLLAAESVQRIAMGQEAHPFVVRVGRAKLCWRSNIAAFQKLANQISEQAVSADPSLSFAPLLDKCYERSSLESLDKFRQVLVSTKDESPEWQLCWLAFVSIVRATSNVGTAQWQYVLPNKSKANVREPFSAYSRQVAQMACDMLEMVEHCSSPPSHLWQEDCRMRGDVPSEWADLIITSPPYINNYDYADATRLEMTMLGEISGWGDLQQSVRRHLVRSCTQHVAEYVSKTSGVVQDPALSPIADALLLAVKALEAEKAGHGGKKNYDAMVAHYFLDMARVWFQLRRIARPGSRVCFVIGDSAPYGVHIPVEQWHGQLALAAGFRSFEFRKLRDRNTKWKNRKHQVPLHEGQLWVYA